MEEAQFSWPPKSRHNQQETRLVAGAAHIQQIWPNQQKFQAFSDLCEQSWYPKSHLTT